MGKRASSQTAAAKAKAAKTEVKPFQAELDLLKASSLPASCKAMWEAMLPHALSTPEAERHSSQKAASDMLGNVFSSLEATKAESVEAAKESLASGEAELAPLESKITAAEVVLAEKSAIRDAAEKASQAETAMRVADSKSTLKAAKEHQGGLAGQREDAEKLQTELAAKKEEFWEPLKANTGPPGSKKQKFLNTVTEVFKKHCGLEESFLTGLPIALRADRTSVGDQLISFGETAWQKKMQECTDIVEGFEAKTAEAAQAVVAAEKEVEAAEAAHDIKLTEFIDAENVFSLAQGALNDATDASKEMKQKVEGQSADVEAAEAQLAQVKELLAACGRMSAVAPEAGEQADE